MVQQDFPSSHERVECRKIRVAWEIDTSGRVREVAVLSTTTGNAELANCVKKEVKKFRFGDQEDDIVVEGYNFILSPR